ncbi:hypothetical protein [Alloalcanivorax xenomutans]|uniref:Uncharacterized protein n=1 Tax=Alloalcanivorax xenomutans TaxID=1094342 RepID=A0A9Q3W4J4_9GAMM|nr:hypothetical protein [Alloalcanivorax xenomutans]MCE7508869.1 hypothetical protein [Alloalcanivorax xenomutans]
MDTLGYILGDALGAGMLTGFPWFLVLFVGFFVSRKKGLPVGIFLLSAVSTILISGFIGRLFPLHAGSIFVLFIIPISVSIFSLYVAYSCASKNV